MEPASTGMNAIRQSIERIIENLAYIRRELPVLNIDAALREELTAFCEGFEQDAKEVGRAVAEGESRIRSRIEELHGHVMRLRELTGLGVDYQALSVLFNESGGNILRAYVDLRGKLPAS